MFYHKLWLLKFEISMFKNIGNRLHAYGNRLLLCKSVWKECWLLVIDYCLLVIDYQRVKLLVKKFSLKNSLEQNCAIQSFLLKKSFYTYLVAFLEVLAYLESSLESWFFTWILTLHLTLDSWLNVSLILKTFFDSWFLTWVFGIIKINLENFASTLDSSCSYHMSPYPKWFVTYEKKYGGNVLMVNNDPCKTVGIGSIQIKMHYWIVRTLANVHHVLELKKNMIFVVAMDSKGFTCYVEGGVL